MLTMKRTFILVAVSVALLSLNGCGSNSGQALSIISTFAEDGETLQNTTNNIKDASVAKEVAYFDLLRDLAGKLEKAISEGRFVVRREPVEKTFKLSGDFYVKNGDRYASIGDIVVTHTEMEPTEITMRDPYVLPFAVPTGPSKHPVWDLGALFIKEGLRTFLWWTGITEGFDYLKSRDSNPTYQLGGATINSPLTMSGSSSWADSHNYTLSEMLAQ